MYWSSVFVIFATSWKSYFFSHPRWWKNRRHVTVVACRVWHQAYCRLVLYVVTYFFAGIRKSQTTLLLLWYYTKATISYPQLVWFTTGRFPPSVWDPDRAELFVWSGSDKLAKSPLNPDLAPNPIFIIGTWLIKSIFNHYRENLLISLNMYEILSRTWIPVAHLRRPDPTLIVSTGGQFNFLY